MINHHAKLRGKVIRLTKILQAFEQGAKRFKPGAFKEEMRKVAEDLRMAMIATLFAEATMDKSLSAEERAGKVRLALQMVEEMPNEQ